jgi:ribonuclease R
MFVRLSDTGADGFVPASTIGLDYYRYDEGSHALIGDKTGETYQLGDQVEVRLVEAAPFAGALTFELLSHGSIAGKRIRKAAPKVRRGPPKGGRSKTSPKKQGRRRSS